ncbi:MAG: hypothetical protein KC419_10625 [Anaerolineales bacterium]|nr:hypothetical protein [Anaerolineales bacterium]
MIKKNMIADAPKGYRLLILLVIFGVLVAIFSIIGSNIVFSEEESTDIDASTIYLPFASEGSLPLICRFGVNVISPISDFDIRPLRVGWYADYASRENPARPHGVKYVQTIRFSQNGDDYIANRSNAQIIDAVTANPGSEWLIGNEPDRRDFQDDLEPHVYAKAYHDMYALIKGEDPTAQIFAGTIVQPTPVRLTYLDMVLDAYQTNYGESMPVDGWSIHNFILNEVSCEYDSSNCWGAEIPPGVNEPFGEVLAIDDNDNIVLFQERIERFRQWMADRGYAGLPLHLTEYGILMPDWLGFDDVRVNTFMNASFDYMLSATDPVLGDPNDAHKLIQRFSWYSTGSDSDVYNGYLFDSDTKQLSPMGINYANYTAAITSETDLYAPDVASESVSGDSVIITATIANSGNLNPLSHPAVIRFYDGNPAASGVQIGPDQFVSLSGCGNTQSVQILWENIAVGSHKVYVVVDALDRISETNENNNINQQLTITINP